MIIGVPKEIKNSEYRIGLVPSGVRVLQENGHRVLVEKSAGEGAGIADAEFLLAGAVLKDSAEEVFSEAEMIVKVKEPQPREYPLLRENQILFTYLHLAPAPELTRALLERKIVGIAYETVQLDSGSLPLLTPMSEIAGKLSIQMAARYLEKENGGSGVLMGGVPGVKPANVIIIGGGTVGLNAAKVALGMGANVTILDTNLDRLRYLSDILDGKINLLSSNIENVENTVIGADVVVGAVLVPGARAKKMVTRNLVSRMRSGSVIVDVSIDQGGCVETSHPTSFDRPVFKVDGVIHYCVANMPGCVARTSTYALTNATFPYILELANLGRDKAMQKDPALRKGLNVFRGKLTSPPVAEAMGLALTPYEALTACNHN
jgi:alanine dehydrogenase